MGCVTSLLFGLRPNYGRGNDHNGNLLQKDVCTHYCIQCSWPHSRPLSTHASAAGSWTLTAKSGSVSCGDIAPFSWLLVHKRFCLCPPRVCFPIPVDILSSNPTGLQSQILWGFSVSLLDPQVGKSVVGPRTFFLNSTRISLVYCSAVCWSSAQQLCGRANSNLLQEGLCHTLCVPGSYTQSPCCCGRPLLTRASIGDTQTLKGRSGSVFLGTLGPSAHKVLFEPSEHLWQVWGLILNGISPLLPSCWGFSVALGCGVSFLGGSFFGGTDNNLSMIAQQWVEILQFSLGKMNTCPSIPSSYFQ